MYTKLAELQIAVISQLATNGLQLGASSAGPGKLILPGPERKSLTQS